MDKGIIKLEEQVKRIGRISILMFPVLIVAMVWLGRQDVLMKLFYSDCIVFLCLVFFTKCIEYSEDSENDSPPEQISAFEMEIDAYELKKSGMPLSDFIFMQARTDFPDLDIPFHEGMLTRSLQNPTALEFKYGGVYITATVRQPEADEHTEIQYT